MSWTSTRRRDFGHVHEQLVDQARAGRHRLIVDLAEVSFLDSSGLGVLVGSLKRARAAGGSVTITGANAHIHDVLRITGLLRVFPVCATIAEALSAAGRRPRAAADRPGRGSTPR